MPNNPPNNQTLISKALSRINTNNESHIQAMTMETINLIPPTAMTANDTNDTTTTGHTHINFLTRFSGIGFIEAPPAHYKSGLALLLGKALVLNHPFMEVPWSDETFPMVFCACTENVRGFFANSINHDLYYGIDTKRQFHVFDGASSTNAYRPPNESNEPNYPYHSWRNLYQYRLETYAAFVLETIKREHDDSGLYPSRVVIFIDTLMRFCKSLGYVGDISSKEDGATLMMESAFFIELLTHGLQTAYPGIPTPVISLIYLNHFTKDKKGAIGAMDLFAEADWRCQIVADDDYANKYASASKQRFIINILKDKHAPMDIQSYPLEVSVIQSDSFYERNTMLLPMKWLPLAKDQIPAKEEIRKRVPREERGNSRWSNWLDANPDYGLYFPLQERKHLRKIERIKEVFDAALYDRNLPFADRSLSGIGKRLGITPQQVGNYMRLLNGTNLFKDFVSESKKQEEFMRTKNPNDVLYKTRYRRKIKT